MSCLLFIVIVFNQCNELIVNNGVCVCAGHSTQANNLVVRTARERERARVEPREVGARKRFFFWF